MQSIFPRVPQRLLDEIINSKCIAVVSHKNPDGDALSSALAFREIATYLGKECIVLNDGPFQRRELDFLSHSFMAKAPKEFKDRNPLVVVLDCSTEDRPGEAYKDISGDKTLVIDHHSSGRPFVPDELSYIVPESPSTTLLIEELRSALKVPLSKEIATYLYIGLATDTGFFHFLSDKTGAYAFYKASLFASVGVNPYEMYDKLNDGKSLEELKTTSSIIENAKLYYSGQLVIAQQPEECTLSRLSDTIYQQLLTVEGVKAIVFIKPKNGLFELGFRAKRTAGIDVGAIAEALGGGGHKLAAGATVDIGDKNIHNFIITLFNDKF